MECAVPDADFIADYLRVQGELCARLGSAFYAALLPHLADDVRIRGPIGAVLADYPHEPVASAMGLRLLGGIHRLALRGDEPELARHYPSTGGDGDAAAAWTVLRRIAETRQEELIRWVRERGVQTNEVGRAAALIGGFLAVARTTGLPLRCLEIGASAGLNLRWDAFRYETAAGAWGDPASPLLLSGWHAGGELPFDAAARVAERAGCDPSPIDPTTDEGRLLLKCFVWPDQAQRLRLLDAACVLARRIPVSVERANGADWLATRLADPSPGLATVVYHSIVLQYLDGESRDRFVDTLAEAGARASHRAPLAWLRMEPGGEQAEVRLTLWPGGVEHLIATTGFHGQPVRWLGLSPAA